MCYINTFIQYALNKQTSIFPFFLFQPHAIASLKPDQLKKKSTCDSITCYLNSLFLSANYLPVSPILLQLARYLYSFLLNCGDILLVL